MCILVSIGGIRLRSAERNKSHMKEKIPALMFNTMNLIFMSHLVCTLRAVRIDIYKDFNTQSGDRHGKTKDDWFNSVECKVQQVTGSHSSLNKPNQMLAASKKICTVRCNYSVLPNNNCIYLRHFLLPKCFPSTRAEKSPRKTLKLQVVTLNWKTYLNPIINKSF